MTRSPAEAQFFAAWRAAHPSLPLGCQVRVLGMARRTIVDFALPAPLHVALEVDGDAWHRNPIDAAKDRRRDEEMGRLGWIIVRIRARDIFREPRATVEKVHQVIAARMAVTR